MNLRQIWVFPIPPIPQRRHEFLDSCRLVLVNLRNEYILKFIKYILPSSKHRTRVGFLSYRDAYLHSISISRGNIVYKRATSDEGILGIRKEKPELDC